MKILLICKFNRFRSKIAESIFNKLNKNNKLKAKSAGIIMGRPISKEVLEASKEKGYVIKGKPQGISSDLLIWQDAIIIVADDVPTSLFKNNKKYGKKLIIWKIPDTDSNNKKELQKIIYQIEIKVKNLIKELK
ncbi:hypothetical protein COU56_02055 [Candidatus Pacearchaeota archaeon CG10_big_fil_rev_8_21_14_0_10_31_9]|nr:MAG: hypothetical protein COU56_02055 [Candidatus Pacearchaeota archaeon CG10_big_fil_rev_8_21_14_0_10_31_9]PIZ82561.1 MAG: hypothetical protein COX97_04150 [Candidatus Pacearchaeota archaeon CG_4_10_14_0_2_um_filter_05_32_18]